MSYTRKLIPLIGVESAAQNGLKNYTQMRLINFKTSIIFPTAELFNTAFTFIFKINA
jgi:hypothetical protein